MRRNPIQDIMDEFERFDKELKDGYEDGRWSYRSDEIAHPYKINDLMNTIIKHERKNNELCLEYYRRQEDNTRIRDISRHFIELYELDIRKSDDNIKLQKLLFFAWLIHYKNNNEYLFETEFIACEHGPGLPELEEARLKYNNITKINNVHDTISETVVLFGQDIEYMDEFNELYNKIRSMKSE